MSNNLLVITGAGGMGVAIARRIGSGKKIMLGEFSKDILEQAVNTLQTDGFQVKGYELDVSDQDAVKRFAQDAANEGHLENIVHTAGVSPTLASLERIYEINLLGTAHVIQAFADVAVPGMTLTCIASMAGYMVDLSPALTHHLATAEISELLKHDDFKNIASDEPPINVAYETSKRGNILRVQAATVKYGQRGARINTISPGFVMTPLGRSEMSGENKAVMDAIIGMTPMKRAGTAEDVARAVAFLADPASNFINGTDLIVDGGANSARVWGSAPEP